MLPRSRLRYPPTVPLFVLVGFDGSASAERRARVRPAHLAHWQPLDARAAVRFGGPLLDAAAVPRGSVLVFEAADLDAARAHAARDPYVTEGVFERFEVYGTRAVFPAA